ncbi:MAG: DNA/RNA non-specific endonuclease [Alistipes sp.]|nr:DNA/RNA non-specific endonuclease [Alistipes sp.]
MRMMRFLNDIFCKCGVVISTLVLLLSAATACDDLDDGGMPIYDSKAWLNYSVAGYNETSISGGIKGDPDYTYKITITAGTEWASLSKTAQVKEVTGRIGIYGTAFLICFDHNETASTRSGEVTIKISDGTSFKLAFSQWGLSDSSEYNRAWGEQPAYKENANYIHKTYYTTLSGQSVPVRNYSICYDLEKLVSHWVAYPIHSSYTGGSFKTRTDAWAFDDAVTTGESDKDNPRYVITYPKIDRSKQQNIIRGSYGDADRSLNRGHMLPSASRYSTWMTNAQTFYATNMFPQNGTLNSGKWGSLEINARNAVCRDTLFCVVGTLYEAGTRQIYSRSRSITVPSHCYKLLLRTKSGNTGKRISEITSADEIMAIGFVWENTADGNNTSIADAAVSIAEIERRSGFKFFHNLNPEIADEVKAQKNYDAWSSKF